MCEQARKQLIDDGERTMKPSASASMRTRTKGRRDLEESATVNFFGFVRRCSNLLLRQTILPLFRLNNFSLQCPADILL